MRKYYVYYQKSSNHSGEYFHTKRWHPWQLVDIAEGTKQLYELFHDREKRIFLRPLNFVMRWNAGNIFLEKEGVEEGRFLIIDDKNRFRDYWKLTSRYRKDRKRHFKRHPYQMRSIHIANDKRQSLTPQELRDIREEYRLYLPEIKSKRKIYPDYDYWYIGRVSRKSKSWKDQSKRKRQYR